MGARVFAVVMISAAALTAEEPRSLLLRGRYAEAIEAADQLAATQPTEALLLKSQALAATGKFDQAQKLLNDALKADPTNVDVARALALICDQYWRTEEAVAAAEMVLQQAPDDAVARWIVVKDQLAGDDDGAKESLAWFAEQHGKHDIGSADEALAIASGLSEHARLARESKWYTAAVNDVLDQAEKRFSLDWRIAAQRAEMFAAKHNEPAAVDALNAALAKNGSAVELHALRSRFAVEQFDLKAARRHLERARQINAELPALVLVEADIALAELRADAAIEVLQSKQHLASHPQIAGRIAAAQHAAGAEAKDKLTTAALVSQGEALDRMRHFSQAATAYRQALGRNQSLPAVRGKLAHDLLRLDVQDEGSQLLAEAYLEDPFDVRLKNTIAVLEVLDTYATLETEHFTICFDRGHDELLARYVAEYLERDVYPQLVQRFGYQPRSKSKIEIYNRARNTSGHGWFSARMVGLPGLHTIGACSGKVVALASPTDLGRPYNWARVLRHEFVHLLNLEQTNFNVPHWVTEGLAVSAEELPRPGAWTKLITQRFKDDQLYTMENINFGFIRPASSEDWTAAYAQANLYIEYLVSLDERNIERLLKAFETKRSASAALEQAAGISADEFEQGFKRYVADLVQQWGLLDSTPSHDVATLTRKVAAAPRNADLLGELAAAHFVQGELPQAKKYANAAAKISVRQATAAWVLASLAMKAGEPLVAEGIAQSATDPTAPHEGLLLLLADVKVYKRENKLAEKLLLLGKKQFPTLEQWNIRLARLYAAQKEYAKLEPVLVELAAAQHDDASITSRLAELALARQDDAALERWSRGTLQIDVKHGPSHAHLAKVLASRGETKAALGEWEAAVQSDIDQQHPHWYLQLAKALLKSGERERAAGILEKLVESSPSLPGLVEAAQELRK